MKFGISTFCLHSRPLAEALGALCGITDTVEIMDDGPHYIEDPEILFSFSFHYALHSPSRGVNIASVLEPIRRSSVEVIGHAFSIAAEVGAPVIIHPGYFAWEQEREKAQRQFLTSREELIRLATEHSVTFFIENMGNWNYFFLRTPDEMEIINGIGFALDVGHAYLNHSLEGFLQHRIRHVHLHDNNGSEDTHDPVGRGSIPFKPVMDAIRRDGATPVIEVASLDGVRESMRVLSDL